MSDIKSLIQQSVGSPSGEVITAKTSPQPIEVKKNKKRRGRPSKVHKKTKLHTILESRGMTRKDLCDLIARKFPNEPCSSDSISRIVSGSRKHYSLPTLYRICNALAITPNMALNWEEEV
tara:strand:+ start:1162 stop:1521 length:360 start_codon:yes stop_codon:yes gene_type:complete